MRYRGLSGVKGEACQICAGSCPSNEADCGGGLGNGMQQQQGNGIWQWLTDSVCYGTLKQKSTTNISKNRMKAVGARARVKLNLYTVDHNSRQARQKNLSLGRGCRRCGLRGGKDRAVGSHLATHLALLPLLCSETPYPCPCSAP